MAEKILIVEDEQLIADILKYNLEREGYRVTVAFDGEQALALCRRENPGLVILDIMLPKLDGFSVCRELRRFSRVPVLILTAKEEEIDKILGLELGADDYVTKPFSPRELIARVKAILRRVQPEAETGSDSARISAGDLTIDPDLYRVIRSGREIELTAKEFDLLKFLAQHQGQIFSRGALCREVWGYDYIGDARTVDVTVRRLREKIESDPSRPDYIRTRRGVGYFFQRPEDN